MLRFILYRAWWSANLFSFAMVAFAAALLVSSVPHRAGLPSAGGICLALSLIIQMTLPLILVLRRSRTSDVDVLLADVFLPWACLYGRPVWLENPQDKLVRGQLKRYSPYALGGQLFAVVLLAVWLLRVVEVIPTVCIVVLVLVGSTALLDASVGNSRANAVSFVVAALGTGPIPSVLSPIERLLAPIGTFIALYLGIKIFWLIAHRLRTSNWSPLNNAIRNWFDRTWLLAEMWLPLCFGTRFIHGGPAVIREVKSTDKSWRAAVLTLLKRVHYAVMDVSSLEPGAGLAWELETCYAKGIQLLLTCDRNKADHVLLHIRAIVPTAIVLPDDFSDVKKFERLNHPGVAIVQLFTYDAGPGTANQFYTQSGVFFGEISLRKWSKMISESR